MQDSNNLKNYISGITKSKALDEKVLFGITLLITLVGCFNFNLAFKIPILIILGLYCFLTKHRIDSINTDNKFLDEDIIQFREIAHELEAVKSNNQNNNKKLQQVTSIIVILHRVVKNLEKCLMLDNKEYSAIKNSLSNTIKEIFEVLTTFYTDYQEHLTIALYIFCPQTKEYLDFISCKPDIMNKGKGRIWAIDDNSHICQAVRQLKVNPNIRDFVYDNINEELPRVMNSSNNDEVEYISSISIPILHDGQNFNAVLSVTSNYPNRFRNAMSVDFQETKINKIFVDLFYAISQILEIAMKNNIDVLKENMIKDILTEYQQKASDKLNDRHISLIKEINETQF